MTSCFSVPLYSQPTTHYVYAMFCQDRDGPGYVKFGRSRQIGKRFGSLRTACPIPVQMFAFVEIGIDEKRASSVETALHRAFADRRTMGEWFRFDYTSADDKREFNDRTRVVLTGYGIGDWWSSVSVRALDAEAKRKQAARVAINRRIRKAQIATRVTPPKRNLSAEILRDLCLS